MIATERVVYAIRATDGTAHVWFGAPAVEVSGGAETVRLRLSEEMAGRAAVLDVGLRHANARRLAAWLLEVTDQ